MDFKKIKAPHNTVNRNLMELCEDTKNIYETVAILGKRANQISANMKREITEKIEELAMANEGAQEVFENHEQTEISRFYEKLPKPTLIASQEFIDNEVYYRNPKKELSKL